MMLIVFIFLFLIQIQSKSPEPVVFARQDPILIEQILNNPASTSAEKVEKNINVVAATQKPTSTKKPTPIATLKPTESSQINIQGVKTTSQVNEKSAVPNDLVNAVNTYRSNHGKNQINTSELLCSVAQKRVDELAARGSLDNHEGFGKYTNEIKQQFNAWWENIFFGTKTIPATEVVSIYWDGSSGHKAAMLSDATHGCGFMKSGYAVLVLGKR